MAKNFIGLGSLKYTGLTAVGLILAGCSAADTAHDAPGVASTEEEIIGGVPAASARLNGVGVLGVEYVFPDIGDDYRFFQPQCTGTLVSANTVLTSASCAAQLEGNFPSPAEVMIPSFGIGPNGNAPARTVEVADIEYAPSTVGYADLAVVHLTEAVTDVVPLGLAALGSEAVGQTFAAIGYGPQTQFYQSGERRAGTATVNAIEGLLYELVFGSFEAFYQFHTGMLPGGGGAGGEGSGEGGSAGGPSAGGSPGSGGVAGGPSGGRPPFPGPWDPDWFEEYLRSVYETTQIGPTEAYTSGPRDAQPCGIDQGGPLARVVAGNLSVHGVFVRTPMGDCARGGVYTRLTPELLTWVTSTLDWVDPCAGVSRTGTCEGSVATRCTQLAEGERYVVAFDCALVGQTCSAPGDAEVACVDPAE